MLHLTCTLVSILVRTHGLHVFKNSNAWLLQLFFFPKTQQEKKVCPWVTITDGIYFPSSGYE